MRAMASLVASLLVFGALAGCIGGKDDEPITENNVSPGTTPGATPGTTPQIKVLAPLATAVTIDAPAWIQSGTEVPVKATAPANAKGTVSYAWAVGALPGTTKVANEVVPDTKVIAPGATGSLTFAQPGVYAMHCHPHPWMLHNVTVVEGYAGPSNVEVTITDGAKENEYRFVPENIVVAPGTKVTYRNVGAQPHTSTAMAGQSPPLKLLPLSAAEGKVKIDGEGWQRIVAIVSDSEGRLGIAEKAIYATKTLPEFKTDTREFTFTYGAAPLAGTPAEAASESAQINLEQPGAVKIDYAFADALGQNGAPENLAQVEVHFTKSGETQDTLTGGPDPEGSLTGKALAGGYTLTVVPLQGAEITGTVTIAVVYDLVPPEPKMPAAGGGHDHGGGGGHQH